MRNANGEAMVRNATDGFGLGFSISGVMLYLAVKLMQEGGMERRCKVANILESRLNRFGAEIAGLVHAGEHGPVM